MPRYIEEKYKEMREKCKDISKRNTEKCQVVSAQELTPPSDL